jgi:hypothetical protein
LGLSDLLPVLIARRISTRTEAGFRIFQLNQIGGSSSSKPISAGVHIDHQIPTIPTALLHGSEGPYTQHLGVPRIVLDHSSIAQSNCVSVVEAERRRDPGRVVRLSMNDLSQGRMQGAVLVGTKQGEARFESLIRPFWACQISNAITGPQAFERP